MRRVAVIATASASGKTTVARRVAQCLDLPYHELDALNHGPNWTEATSEELRAAVEPLVAAESWVIDGGYRGKIGDLVLAAADTVVWLDPPVRVWLTRLVRRSVRRSLRREELWNGNRETLRDAFWGREALIPYGLRHHWRRRRVYPVELARYPVVRLRSQAEIDAWLSRLPDVE